MVLETRKRVAGRWAAAQGLLRMQASLTDPGGCNNTRRVGSEECELQRTRGGGLGWRMWTSCLVAGDPSSGVDGGWNFGVVAETVDAS